MGKIHSVLAGVAALSLAGGPAMSEPAIIYDIGGKFDKSFNESAYNGAETWKEQANGDYREIELQSEAQREQAIRRLAEAGNNPIAMPGFSFGTPLNTVAPEFPDTKFVIIDMVVDQPNVRSVLFKEHEGSYVVGVLAAMASDSGTVGFVGGMDIPLIRKFSCGYVQGVMETNPDARVIQNMTGTTGAAWNDPVKGAELARAQVAEGADVIYHAAGGTGVGVLQAAADAGVLGIGVDANQNYLQPGSVLTSMVKRVGSAVLSAFSDGPELETGIVEMGFADGGISYALDEHNAPLVTDEMKAAADSAVEKIMAGEIMVHNYLTSDSCPYG
ncbi:MAG: BMP family ABC transporter substrate-binding protein [Albidovulum sp.]|nr:BMP family ABC transporter substrate-binding protein [Albidovulum sp.]MDE0533974.1 BMP family ABC transporter substrate-binding protein [Albidovulum sp.]